MSIKSIDDLVDEAFTLADAYHEAMNNWNGDNDGPMDRATEKLSNGLSELFKEAILLGYKQGSDRCIEIMNEPNQK